METSTKKTTLASGREAERAKRNRQRTKEKKKKLQAQNDFLWKRYKAIAEEFEREYAETNGQIDKEPLPTAVIPPYEHLPPNHNNVSTEPLPSAVIPPFEHIPSSHSETLNTLSELDLGDINIDLFGDINIDLFGDTNLDLLGDPYMNS